MKLTYTYLNSKSLYCKEVLKIVKSVLKVNKKIAQKPTRSRKSTSFGGSECSMTTLELRRKKDEFWKGVASFKRLVKKLSHMDCSDKFTPVICFNDNQPDTFCWTKTRSIKVVV